MKLIKILTKDNEEVFVNPECVEFVKRDVDVLSQDTKEYTVIGLPQWWVYTDLSLERTVNLLNTGSKYLPGERIGDK